MSSPTLQNLDGGWRADVAAAAPLFKWAGGKQRFLWEHRERIPNFEGRYFEPFAGGLSILFFVARRSAAPVSSVVSDTNLRLVRCYQEIRKDWQSVADRLAQIAAAYAAAEDKAKFYYQLRDEYNRLGAAAGAARFIALMTAGWNGVYRVNQKGGFNVPHGVLKEKLSLPTPETLRAVSAVLVRSEIRASSWESTVSRAREGDFVFLDPPYYSETRGQLYGPASNSFTLRDQARLADALVDLSRRGVSFLLTNAGHPAMVELYQSRGMMVEVISMHRSINSKLGGRGAEAELIVTPRDTRSTRQAEAELALRVRVSRKKSKDEGRDG